jgi:hypothetical protein
LGLRGLRGIIQSPSDFTHALGGFLNYPDLNVSFSTFDLIAGLYIPSNFYIEMIKL